MMRDRSVFYDTIASEFDQVMNKYEVHKRLHLLFSVLLPDSLEGQRVLDAGCGTGWFTQELARRRAEVVALDIGHTLLKEVERKHDQARLVQSDLQRLAFASNHFDAIICTEAIEHTPDPRRSVSELLRVLRPGGILALTVPNRVWHFSVSVASLLNIRPYKGYENWVRRRDLHDWVTESGATVERMIGFNLFPLFYRPFYGVLDFADQRLTRLQPIMVNIGIRVRK